MSVVKRGSRHSSTDLVDRGTRRESFFGRRSHTVSRDRVGVPEIAVVIVVGCVVDVRNMRVGDVDVVEVACGHISAAVIPAAVSPAPVARIVRRTPSQRDTSQSQCRYRSPSRRPIQSQYRSQGRQSSRPARERSRDSSSPAVQAPTPAAAVADPAAIVEGSESPRSAIDPRPSPRGNPRPLPVAIRRPAHRHRRGIQTAP